MPARRKKKEGPPKRAYSIPKIRLFYEFSDRQYGKLKVYGRKSSSWYSKQERLAELIGYFKSGMTNYEAFYLCGLFAQQFYDFLDYNPHFKEYFEAIKKVPVIHAKKLVYKLLEAKSAFDTMDPKLVIETCKWILERKSSEEFGYKAQITNTNTIENTVSDKDKEEIAREILREIDLKKKYDEFT